jgi:hypothetical protein
VNKIEEHQEQVGLVNEQMEVIAKQHIDIIMQIKQVSQLQAEIAQQVVNQHKDVESLYIALGLKKSLSQYSFNMMNEEEH